MAKLKKCLSELNGLLSQEEEKFLIKTEEDSQIGNDVQAANFAITQYYKQLHDKLNDLKTKVGLSAMPYPDFVLANEAVPKTEYKPKLPSEKQVASAKKAMRYKEAEKAFSLIGRYKSLSRAAKRGSVGSAIMSAIRDEVARINADILLTSRGVKVIEKDGSVVSKPPARSSADFVSMQKERKQILKDALNAEPDTLEYAVIQDIANGAVFSLESFKKYTKLKGKEIEAAPSYLINDNPNSKKLDLYTRNEGIFAIDEKSSAELIAETLQNYFTKNARERAAIDLVAMYEDRFLEKKEQGRSKEELKELELLELENEELLKAVEDIEAEIAEMAKKDLDIEEAINREERDLLEQDKMEDELNTLLRLENASYPEGDGDISTAPPLTGKKQTAETDVKKQIEDFGVANDQVGPVYSVIYKVFQGIKDAGLTTAVTVGDWVGISKGKEKPSSLFKDGQSQKEFGGFETRDGKPIGFKYDTEQVARQRFDFSKLTKIGSGSDRDVYDLGNGKALKVAKTARGLNQNIYEGDYYLKGIVPEVYERGLNYVVVEKVDSPAKNNQEVYKEYIYNEFEKEGFTIGEQGRMLYIENSETLDGVGFDELPQKLQKLGKDYGYLIGDTEYKGRTINYTPVMKKIQQGNTDIVAIDEMLDELKKFTQVDFDKRNSKLQEALEKYNLSDIMSYNVLWGDFVAKRNWGVKNGLPVHVDGGTFGGVQMLNEYEGKTNMSDPEFRSIYEQSRKLKKEFGDTDEATMYKKDSEEIQAQYRIEKGKNIIEAIKDFSGSPKAVVALTHEIMHPTVVAIIDGAKEGNEIGLKHTKTIVSEFNKATGENLTMDELIAGNDAFRDGKTTKQYRDVQEFISESWEKYHTEGGKGFSNAFQQVLAQITEAFKAVYSSLSGKQITPELRNFFDEILGKDQVSGLNKQRQKESSTLGSFDKVYNAIKKALPKVNVMLDDTIRGAGEVEGNTLKINPDYAGLDTPIHEAGHILIDAIGYNNKVIQAAIAELKKTPLWKETKEAYRELSEEMLGKEVLAEAIGREGAGIFETESQKSKFKAMLSYIFDRIKRLLGIEKNVAKSLAKQIIAGIGTKDLVGTTAQAQMAKRKVLSDAQAQVKELVDAIAENEDLSSIPYEELLDVYNAINAQDIPGKSKYLRDVKIRIGMNIFEREKTKLQKNKDFSADRAATKDVTTKDVKFKVLSHFTDAYPEFKSLSEMWDAAYFAKIKESREGKNTNEKLAIEVIKDRNSRLGITQRAIEMVQSLFTSVNYKYFSFLDNGKGKLVTLSEAKKKGYSKAQIEYLKFVRDLIASRKILMDSDDIYNMDMEVLKLDKGFSEAFKTDGLAQAFGNWLSSSDGLRETQIEFKNPITGKTSITSYQNAETALVKYGEKGPKEKAQSIALILKYNFAARRKKSDAENKQRGTYYLDENGQLKSKFDRKRPPEASYSTDFYKAVSEYIDDNAHITHISPLMPVIESIEYLNKRGVYEFDDDGNKTPIHAKKPNVVKWINEWRDLHVLRQKDEGIPELDASLKFLRFLTSATTMMFNATAGVMNIAIGNLNSWIFNNSKTIAKGNARLFGGKKKFTSDYGYGLINPIAVDIARKYNAVSTDVDSNPIQTLGGIMSKLGHAITKYGEFQIQASGLLGLMSDEDFNSFEYRKNKFGVDELVFKKTVPPQKQLEIESRILKHINTISDVQGKYSEKDRRNIQNNELGKALMQFKVYLPDYWRMRFGKDVGSWYITLNGGLKEIKNDIKRNGLKKGLWDNESKEAKAFMSNLKETALIAFFMILSHSDDDDDEGALEFTDKMLSNLLGVFDPVQLKFTLTRPIAAMGVVDRFLTAVEHLSLWSEDAYMKSDSKYGEKGDAKILNDIKGLIPGRKAADALDMFSEDEE